MIKTIPIEKIKTKDTLQPRAQMDLFTVDEYAQAMQDGRVFPPIEVVSENGFYWMWDGYHRKQAAERCEFTEIDANVIEGTFQDAEWLALSANKTHGKTRNNDDKQRVVKLAFQHPKTIAEFERLGKINYSVVALHCGVSHQFVADRWYELHPKVSEKSENCNHCNFQNFQETLKLDNGKKKKKTTKPSPTERIAPELRQEIADTDLAEDKKEIAALARLKPEVQEEVTKRITKGDAKTVKAARKQIEKERQIEAIENTEFPEGKYHIIVIDPPWRYEKRANDPTHRAANPYPDMSVEEIKALDVPGIALDDCILWLWTTNAFMEQAHQMARHWGFEVKTILTWVKSKMGTGDWLRGKTEHCLMCVKGKPVVELTNQTTVIEGPLREHSRKPDEFYDLVDALCPGNKVELYARNERDGWSSHGNETDRFNTD